MKFEIVWRSERARQARYAKAARPVSNLAGWLAGLLFAAAVFTGLWQPARAAYFCAAAGLAVLMFYLWYKRELAWLKPSDKATSLDGVMEQNLLARLNKRTAGSLAGLANAAASTNEGRFLLTRLMVPLEAFTGLFQNQAFAAETVWQQADNLRQSQGSGLLDGACLAAALLTATPPGREFISKSNLSAEDVAEVCGWSLRLSAALQAKRPFYGGLGRDWSAGYTLTLDRYAENISRYVEFGHGHFHTLAHADILKPIADALAKQTSVALVGETGTGKSSLVYALAEMLLSGADERLLYYQIYKLNASQILASAGGQLESILLRLLAEAVKARNVILFLDEAELFFGEGTGAFNAGQLLLPIFQNRALKIITAWTPDDFQQLKAKDANLASQFTTINVSQPDMASVSRIAEDSALTFGGREGVLITYQAVKEAVRLSGQYLSELAYPGKAVGLLEQSVTYAQDGLVTDVSVQSALENSRGVKVAKAGGPETDLLLHLEDKIHSRMINQEPAVKAVAKALRRSRAGVGDPSRPIGTFLFLGPTGVGKTELARSLAAVYFGDEKQMIRLDMSEYQQAEDAGRLLAPGGSKDKSLVLQIREQPFSVVLLDEVEKAHPNILNLLLQMLDEGKLTDSSGKPASFKNAIVIATSNAGSAEITKRVAGGDSLENYEKTLIDGLIQAGQFRAEIINRFDEVVLFRPLNADELAEVAKLLMKGVNANLSKQNISVSLAPDALTKVVAAGYDPQFGARPMRRAIQEMVESAVADKILKGESKPGSQIVLTAPELGEPPQN